MNEQEIHETAAALQNRLSGLEGRVAVCETRISVAETRIGVSESRIESERGTLQRMEVRFYEKLDSVGEKLDGNRANTDEKLNKLFRMVYIGYGIGIALPFVFKITEFLLTKKP